MHQVSSIRQIIRKYAKSINSNLINLLKAMPKEQKHIVEAQKHRKRIKEKSNKYSPGRVTLQVLGTGAKGAPSSLYVFSDQSRYLFNCGEGTQRLAHEHKMKLAKLEHIFFTETNWKNIGGLPGAALTIQDVGVPEITLHGPEGLEEIFEATHRFVIIKDLDIKVAECRENGGFEDNVMKISYVPLEPSGKVDGLEFSENGAAASTQNPDFNPNLELSEDDIDYYAYAHNGKRKPPRFSQMKQLFLEQNKQKRLVMAYICKLQPRPGALCLDKCVKLGVPPGPFLGKLKSGESVTLANGNVVKSSDVCEPDDPGPVFIVVECPSEDYLDSLINNETFKKHQVFATKDEDFASLIVHFTPKHIMDHPKYKQWIENFSPSTLHIVLNESNTCMGSLSVHRIQHKLNLLTANIFPLLGDNGTEIIDQQESVIPATKKIKSEGDSVQNSLPLHKLSVKSRPSSPPEPYIFPNTLYNHHLRPKKGLDRSLEIKIFPSQYIEETMIVENFQNVLLEMRQQMQCEIKKIKINDYPKLLFLGTGSSIPNKTRNTSGILLEVDEDCSILMDCGEGTCGQIIRFFGATDSDRVLSKIKAVYISHLHADHHLGLIGLIQWRRKANIKLGLENNKLFLFAPKQILSWLTFYHNCFESIQNEFELIPNSNFLLNKCDLVDGCKENFLNDLKLNDVSTCFVRHCPNAFGVSFRLKSGRKITYSGDTMPSDNLIQLGENSDLLIHEATMEDELSEEAIIKLHSTTSQAIEVGRVMNAKFTLLTHFSQRYAKLPRFNDNFSGNVGIAFDNMRIKLDELPLLPILYPALKLMFAEHYEELEHKAVKRQLKLDREKEALLEKQQNCKS